MKKSFKQILLVALCAALCILICTGFLTACPLFENFGNAKSITSFSLSSSSESVSVGQELILTSSLENIKEIKDDVLYLLISGVDSVVSGDVLDEFTFDNTYAIRGVYSQNKYTATCSICYLEPGQKIIMYDWKSASGTPITVYSHKNKKISVLE